MDTRDEGASKAGFSLHLPHAISYILPNQRRSGPIRSRRFWLAKYWLGVYQLRQVPVWASPEMPWGHRDKVRPRTKFDVRTRKCFRMLHSPVSDVIKIDESFTHLFFNKSDRCKSFFCRTLDCSRLFSGLERQRGAPSPLLHGITKRKVGNFLFYIDNNFSNWHILF